MILGTERELKNTQEKLARLEARYETLRSDTKDQDEFLREVSTESIKRLINQFKEEIAWYESRQPASR